MAAQPNNPIIQAEPASPVGLIQALGVLFMVTLDPSRIPIELHGLISLAEKFGVSDDCLRERLVKNSSSSEIKELKSGIRFHEDALDNWLAGPEAQGPHFLTNTLPSAQCEWRPIMRSLHPPNIPLHQTVGQLCCPPSGELRR